MTVGIIGTSIWQQNLPLLERLTIDRDSRESELQRLKNALGLSELIYLATCNRVEILFAVDCGECDTRRLHRLIDFFFRGRREISFFPNDFYNFTGREANLWWSAKRRSPVSSNRPGRMQWTPG